MMKVGGFGRAGGGGTGDIRCIVSILKRRFWSHSALLWSRGCDVSVRTSGELQCILRRRGVIGAELLILLSKV